MRRRGVPAIRDESGNKRKRNATSYKPGQSGNPKGRPKLKESERDALEQIKKLAPEAVETMRQMLQDPIVPAAVKARLCELVLDRVFGKPDSSVKLEAKVQKGDFVLEIGPGDGDAEDQA